MGEKRVKTDRTKKAVRPDETLRRKGTVRTKGTVRSPNGGGEGFDRLSPNGGGKGSDKPSEARRDLPSARPVLTIGHSTRPLAEFIELLTAQGVERLLDVRTVPRSRHNPQYGGESLAASLAEEGIAYEHVAGLGGFRRTHADSPNAGWRNLSFRGYADYMQTPEFARNLERLLALAKEERVVLMCAEAVPWRCHRSLIADALLVHGVPAEEIVSPTRRQPHKLTPFAHVEGETITYPPYDESGAPA
jgi:hypothetical protein